MGRDSNGKLQQANAPNVSRSGSADQGAIEPTLEGPVANKPIIEEHIQGREKKHSGSAITLQRGIIRRQQFSKSRFQSMAVGNGGNASELFIICSAIGS
jgi:hypothetical protein